MKSYFFNAEPTADLVTHPTGFDRTYDADDQAAFFEPFFTGAGVFAGTNKDACKVAVKVDGGAGGVLLSVGEGTVYVKGRMAIFDGTETVTTMRDCKVVARMNKTADVRGFQLLAVTELTQTEDVYDLELAQVVLKAVVGGYEAVVTDTRAFIAFTGQPPYYPPDSDSLPYILWLYTLGFPMTPEQRSAVTGNPSLMSIFDASIGASRADSVAFTADEWVKGETVSVLRIPQAKHGRRSSKFGYTLRHLVDGVLKGNTWGVVGTSVAFNDTTKDIELWSADIYPGEIVFFG